MLFFKRRWTLIRNIHIIYISLIILVAYIFYDSGSQTFPCPSISPFLSGEIIINSTVPSEEDDKWMELAHIQIGGHGVPICTSQQRVAIVVPYRNREDQLRVFVYNIHKFLSRQLIEYRIFLIEPSQNETFNRAKLMNIGYEESQKFFSPNCFIFHDVDLLPIDDRNQYKCEEKPLHMSVLLDKWGFRLPYSEIFGGVVAMTHHQFGTVNGFSNNYWGWGGEDDDMFKRLASKQVKTMRRKGNHAKYRMIKHKKEGTNRANPCRFHLMDRTIERMHRDGLNTLEYTVEEIMEHPLYTKVSVNTNEEKAKEELRKEGIDKCKITRGLLKRLNLTMPVEGRVKWE